MILRFLSLAALFATAIVSVPARAENVEVPYWASIRAETVNMRVGPGEDYRIEWVYHRQHLPMKVLRLMESWRLVQDPDGARGWILSRFLTRDRGAIVIGQAPAEIREKADGSSRLLWRAEPGVVGKLGDCESGWCRIDLGGHVGYVPQPRVWGAGKP